jgi:hypothetical protein
MSPRRRTRRKYFGNVDGVDDVNGVDGVDGADSLEEMPPAGFTRREMPSFMNLHPRVIASIDERLTPLEGYQRVITADDVESGQGGWEGEVVVERWGGG